MRIEAQSWRFCAIDFLRAAGMPDRRSSMSESWISTACARRRLERERTWFCTLLLEGFAEGHRSGRHEVTTLPTFSFTLGLVPDV